MGIWDFEISFAFSPVLAFEIRGQQPRWPWRCRPRRRRRRRPPHVVSAPSTPVRSPLPLSKRMEKWILTSTLMNTITRSNFFGSRNYRRNIFWQITADLAGVSLEVFWCFLKICVKFQHKSIRTEHRNSKCCWKTNWVENSFLEGNEKSIPIGIFAECWRSRQCKKQCTLGISCISRQDISNEYLLWYLQKSASIQPRSSRRKYGDNQTHLLVFIRLLSPQPALRAAPQPA